MILRDHYHLLINVIIVVYEKVYKLGHKDLLLAEGIIKGGDASGIPSLHIDRVCRLVEALSCSNLNAKCDYEFGCSVDSTTSPINYISCIFCVTGERFYDAEK